MKSKLGLFLVLAYIFVIGGITIYALTCSDGGPLPCGLSLFVFSLPWLPLLFPLMSTLTGGESRPSAIIFLIFIPFLLNSIVIYFAGVVIEKIFRKVIRHSTIGVPLGRKWEKLN